MNRQSNNGTMEEIVNSFIDDLNAEKKPEAYKYLKNENDRELEKLFETVRAVKRLRKSNIPSVSKNEIVKDVKRRRLPILIKTAVAASVLILIFVGGSLFDIFNTTEKQQNEYNKFLILGEDNIVHAMEKAYEELTSYSGVIEIKSISNGEVEFLETINVEYKKPNKYRAVHEYNGYTYTQISDGNKLYTIDNDRVTVDYSNLQKELWRYHIGSQIQELEMAKDIKKLDSEVLADREVDVYAFRFDENENYHRIWIDKETNLPLKKELNLADNRKLINHFIEIEVNSLIDDSVFKYDLKPEQKVVELNQEVTVDEFKEYWNKADNIIKTITSNNMSIVKAVKSENEIYKYQLKFKGNEEGEFIDLYVTNEPFSNFYIQEAQHGTLGSGWVEIQENAVNVFKVYIGKSNVVKWVTSDWELVMVSNKNPKELIKILEKVEGNKINYISIEQLEKMGIEGTVTKEGH